MNAGFVDDWIDNEQAIGHEARAPLRDRAGETLPEAYYDGTRHDYWIQDRRKGWVTVTETALKRLLRGNGISAQVINGESLSALDAALLEINVANNVAYAGALAGYHSGVHEILQSRVLVTNSPRLIESAPGECPTINGLLAGMFLDDELDQSIYLFGWLKFALEALYERRHRPGQAMVIAGPANCGKSLVQKLITEMLGGRMAKPFQYMVGKTDFNAHMFGAEHLVIEDEAASTDIRARREFGAHLKEITVNDHQSCHAKGRTPVSLTPFWRLSVTVNEEPENLMVLPPINEDLRDKMILLKAQLTPMPMPTNSLGERRLFIETLHAELPAFVDFLLDWKVPVHLECPRFGVKHFHHPSLLQAIEELAPERRLLSIIDSGGLFAGPIAEAWEGSAEQLERRLRQINSGSFEREVDRLLGFNNACGVFLGRLAGKYPERITKRTVNGYTRWTVQPPKGGG